LARVYLLMQTAKTRLLLLILFIGLTGCGLKGPLYLPVEESAAPAGNPENAAATPEATEKEKKKKDSDTA